MGYSLAVKFKTMQERDVMYQFYSSNLDIIESLSLAEKRTDVKNYMDLFFEERLSYSPKMKCLLGFDGPSGRPYYLELLLAWMAVKSTFRDKSNEPFIYYDSEKIKIQQPNGLILQVDKKGLQSYEVTMDLKKKYKSLEFVTYGVTDFKKYAQEIATIFTDLENRWQIFQLENTKKSKVSKKWSELQNKPNIKSKKL